LLPEAVIHGMSHRARQAYVWIGQQGVTVGIEHPEENGAHFHMDSACPEVPKDINI